MSDDRDRKRGLHSAPTQDISETAGASPGPPFGTACAHPEHIGPCRVIRELGRGGMGIVYLGMREDGRFKRHVAVKVLKRGMDTGEILRRFELERQMLAALNHPNIARLYDGGETEDGHPYFVMEYVEGQPIDEYCDSHRLRIAERLELFRSVCSAVHCSHQNLIVHRDLKPANVLVTGEGVPKLLDFGIAKLITPELSPVARDPTDPGVRVMTPEYASPEQVRGYPMTTASDVYSLGVMLYELMTGHRPYRLRSHGQSEIERVICEEDPARPSTAVSRVEQRVGEDPSAPDSTKTITPEAVSRVREGRPDRLRKRLTGDIDNIVLMAMRKEPQRRYASAEQLSEDIRRHFCGLPVIAHRDTLRYRSLKFLRRHRTGVAATVIVIVSLLAGIIGTSSGWKAESRQRAIAEAARDRAEEKSNQVRALANTMMFDIHDAIVKLDGALPAHELVVTNAFEYLDGLAQEAQGNTELTREVASAYERVGDIQGGIRNPSRGETADALASYRQALALRQTLVSASPDDPELKNELVHSHVTIGDGLRDTGGLGEARREYRQAVAIAEELPGDNPTYRRTLAIALNALGDVSYRMGRLDEAALFYERSLSIRLELASANPTDLRRQRDVSVLHTRLAAVREKAGDLDGALDHFNQVLAIREGILKAEPDSGRAKRDLAFAHYYVGQTYIAMQKPTKAMEQLEKFMPVAQQRVEDNPESTRARRDLVVAYEAMGHAYALQNEWSLALAEYRLAHSWAHELAHAHPDNTQFLSLEASALERLGEVAEATGDPPAAAQRYREALEIIEPLARQEFTDVRRQIAWAALLRKLGSVLARSSDLTEARRRFELAISISERLLQQQPDNAPLLESLESTRAELAKLN